MIEISVLETGYIPKSDNSIKVIYEILELSKSVEKYGFKRFWITEHQDNSMAWYTPEIIITLIAGYTTTIRVGVAGVLLPVNICLKVAQQYALLNNLFNDRIDLGIAKGYSANRVAEKLLESKSMQTNIEHHIKRVKEINKFFSQQIEKYPIAPIGGKSPEIWILGTSLSSFSMAVKNNYNFSYSFFHHKSVENGIKITPKVIDNLNGKCLSIAISAICHNNKIKAKRMYAKYQSKRTPFKVNVIGNFYDLYEYIMNLHSQYFVSEFVIICLNESIKEKIVFYKNVSRIFNLIKPKA